MKLIRISFNYIALILCLFSTIQIQAQDSAKIAETKAKIAELEKQKASIDAEIGKFKATLPVPVKPNWTYKGNLALNIGQNLFSNYAAGGISNFNFQALLHVEANYEKGPHRWLNSFDGRMGFVKNYDPSLDVDMPLLKNSDVLQLSTKYFYNINKSGKWSGAFISNFTSQFIKTWDNNNDTVLVSDFMAPGILELNPGIEYRPLKYLSIFFSPGIGKFTFVTNDYLISRPEGAFGNKQNQNIRSEFGAKFDASFEKELFKNFLLRSRLQLFNNYLRSDRDPDGSTRRWEIDVTSQTDIFYKLNKYIAFNLSFLMLYDADVLITNPKTFAKERKLQIKESFGVGMVFGF